MEPGVEISGRVVRGGAGVEGAMVVAMTPDDPHMANTGPDGSFRIADLTPGQTMLSIGKQEEFIQTTRSVTAPESDIVIEIPAGGRITGRVVDKTTRKPVTTFEASIAPQRGGGMMMIAGGRGQRTFTSDDGSFVLENVPPGTIQMIVSSTGYAAARIPNLTVESGKTLADLEVALDTGVRLYGKVTGPDGPIAGTTVRIEQRGGPGQRMFGETATFTDASGEYSLESLEPGEKTFVFSHESYPGQTRTVNLSGRETRLDVELTAGQRVTGVVVTESGAPVADATVRASSAADTSFGRAAQTDGNGTFTFEGLTPANYSFTAQKSGYATATVRDFDIRGGASPRIVLASGGIITGRVLGLKESDRANARVMASGAGAFAESPVDANGNFRIEGAPIGTVRVWASTRGNFAMGKDSAWKSVEVSAGAPAQVDIEFNSDTVIRGRITRGGSPVAGAVIRFEPRSATAQTRSGATSDSSGNYEVTGLDDGTYMVAIIDMERGSNTTTYEVRGSSTYDIDLKSATLRGRVVDATTRQPIDAAEIQVRPATTGQESFYGMRTGASDSSGAFIIDNVTPGTYTVRAAKQGYGHDTQNATVGEDTATTVELKLASSTGLTINLVDARTNVGLNGSAYAVDARGNVANEGWFDGSGSKIQLAIAPGQYRVTLNARGYAPQTVLLTAPGEQTVGLTPGGTLLIRSKRAEPLRGRLLDSSGQPHQPRSAYFPVDASPGVATVRNLAPGNYTLQILGDDDKVLASAPVVINEGATTDITL
jgi:protocatechuate 3,4-dioxygenase beta subunit